MPVHGVAGGAVSDTPPPPEPTVRRATGRPRLSPEARIRVRRLLEWIREAREERGGPIVPEGD